MSSDRAVKRLERLSGGVETASPEPLLHSWTTSSAQGDWWFGVEHDESRGQVSGIFASSTLGLGFGLLIDKAAQDGVSVPQLIRKPPDVLLNVTNLFICFLK